MPGAQGTCRQHRGFVSAGGQKQRMAVGPIVRARGTQGVLRRPAPPGSQGRVGDQGGPREGPRLPSGTAGTAPLTRDP